MIKRVKGVALLGVVLGLGACNESNPFAGETPVGERCGSGPVEDFAGRASCRKGDTIETLKPSLYCDFNYPLVTVPGGAFGLSGSIVSCVYVGELRKEREISAEDAKSQISDSAAAVAKARAAAAKVRADEEAKALAQARAEQAKVEAQARAEQAKIKPALESIAAEMVEVRGGSFQMGCSPGDTECSKDEKPAHQVAVQPFRMGKYEVTQAQWQAVMGANPAHHKGDDRPVEHVSWDDAQAFLKRLNAAGAGKPYRLPTEAEWEYAARAGTQTPYWWGKEVGKGNANCNGCDSQWDGKGTAPVGSFKPNPFGLYDTAGNVWEWVQDCYHNSYAGAPADGSEWLGSCESVSRVIRGGSWVDRPAWLRSAYRDRNSPSVRVVRLGFRLAQDL